MRQHNLKVTGSLQINGENVISASELSTLSASINSKIEGLNPSQIGTGSYTASISPNGAFSVNTNTIITGSLSVSSLSGSGINYLAYSGGVVTAISGTAAIKYNQEFTATLGQTTFTPSIGYITDLIDVFYNGTKLSETDYTASNGSTIILSQGADLAGDIIEVAIYNPVSGVSNNTLRQQTTFTASASQTTFSVNYTPGLIDVYFNGSHLANEEYTANNGTSIILSEAATGGEIVDVFVYSYQVGAFSGIGGQGQAGQFAYFSSQNGISGSSIIAISGSDIIAGGDIIPSQSGSYDLGSLEKPFRHIYVGTGSIYLVDNSGQVTNTISAQTIVTTDTLASGTIDLTDSLPSGTVSGSSQVVGILSSLNTATASFTPRISNLESKSASVDITLSSINSKTGSYATTGSNSFYGTQVFSGSVYIANDLIVQGSSSIQYISASSVSIGTNIVQLNTANPSVRFAGLTIIDSGSIGGSGSFLYDSVHDEFVFVHRGNGTNVTSSHFVLGPETYDSLGNETYLTCNRITKGTGKEHLVDSSIFDNGTTVCINGNTITNNIIVSNNQNTATQITICNTTCNTSATSELAIGSDVCSGFASIGKYSTGTTAYKTIASKDMYIYNQTGGDISVLNNIASGNIKFTAGGCSSPHLYINCSGNVGIGTVTPTGTYGKLTVTGGISILNDNCAKLQIGRYSNVSTDSYIVMANGSTGLTFTNANDVADVMRITTGGNVGIGTNSPSGTGILLNVKGITGNTIGMVIAESADGCAMVSLYSGSGIGDDPSLIYLKDLRFGSGNKSTSGYVERMRIASCGNVGIGLTCPVEKLDIMGALRVRCNTPGFTAACNSLVIDYANTCIFGSSPMTRYYSIGCTGVSAGHSFLVGEPSVGYSAFIIGGSGHVTKPCSAAFHAAINSSTCIGPGGTMVKFNCVIYNAGGGYDGTTSTFTAPVSGMYQFNFTFLNQNTQNVEGGHAYLSTSSGVGTYYFTRYGCFSGIDRTGYGNYVPMHGAIAVYLPGGARACVAAFWDASGAFTHNSTAWSNFTGYLVG